MGCRGHARNVLGFFLLPAFFLAACALDDWTKTVEELPEVIYSEDWKYITLYLDDSLVVNTSDTRTRKMTPDTARAGYDYFEVIFCSGDNIARTYWERGERAGISNVYRTRTGVTYSLKGENRAVLFAGRMSDRTLLAVGELVSVDDVPGTTVRNSSSYVTFKLSALTAGAAFKPEESTFLTAAVDPSAPPASENTIIMNAHIGTRNFPLYKLPGGYSEIEAIYRFDLDGALWEDYSESIIIRSAGKVEKRDARYSVGNASYRYAVYENDLTTVVTMTNNQYPEYPAESPVKFSFNTVDTVYPISSQNGIFTMVFEIPIYAITSQPYPGAYDAVLWTIRPAYSTYLYYIDNGETAWGGAVLIGVNMDADDLNIPVTWG